MRRLVVVVWPEDGKKARLLARLEGAGFRAVDATWDRARTLVASGNVGLLVTSLGARAQGMALLREARRVAPNTRRVVIVDEESQRRLAKAVMTVGLAHGLFDFARLPEAQGTGVEDEP